MRRRYLIWMLGAREMIRIEVEGQADCEIVEHHLDTGTGAIRYGGNDSRARSYLMARNVAYYHVEDI